MRHTGNSWHAETGATLRELMERMGHSSTKAALTYIHSRDGRQRLLAEAMSERVAGALRKGSKLEGEDGLSLASGT